MSTYTSENSVVYELVGGSFFKTGDLVVLSKDKCAWRVKKASLAAASSVFKGMFEASSLGGGELLFPDGGREGVQDFLSLLLRNDDKKHVRWGDGTSTTVELLERFDCAARARDHVYRCAESVPAHFLFEAFATAYRFDDAVTGCRILNQGYKWYRPKTNHSGRPLSPNLKPWSAKEAARLQSTWVWALTLAAANSGDVNTLRDALKEPKYWRGLVGEFMSNLTQ